MSKNYASNNGPRRAVKPSSWTERRWEAHTNPNYRVDPKDAPWMKTPPSSPNQLPAGVPWNEFRIRYAPAPPEPKVKTFLERNKDFVQYFGKLPREIMEHIIPKLDFVQLNEFLFKMECDVSTQVRRLVYLPKYEDELREGQQVVTFIVEDKEFYKRKQFATLRNRLATHLRQSLNKVVVTLVISGSNFFLAEDLYCLAVPAVPKSSPDFERSFRLQTVHIHDCNVFSPIRLLHHASVNSLDFGEIVFKLTGVNSRWNLDGNFKFGGSVSLAVCFLYAYGAKLWKHFPGLFTDKYQVVYSNFLAWINKNTHRHFSLEKNWELFKVSQAAQEPKNPDHRTWKPMSAQDKKFSKFFAMPVVRVQGPDYSKRPNADETLPCNVCFLRFPTWGFSDAQMRQRGHCFLCAYVKFEEECMDAPYKRKYRHDEPEEEFCRNCPDKQLSLAESTIGYCMRCQNARRAPCDQWGLSFPQRTIIKNEQKAHEAKLRAAEQEALKPKPGSRHEALCKIDKEQQAFLCFQYTEAYSLNPELHDFEHDQKVAKLKAAAPPITPGEWDWLLEEENPAEAKAAAEKAFRITSSENPPAVQKSFESVELRAPIVSEKKVVASGQPQPGVNNFTASPPLAKQGISTAKEYSQYVDHCAPGVAESSVSMLAAPPSPAKKDDNSVVPVPDDASDTCGYLTTKFNGLGKSGNNRISNWTENVAWETFNNQSVIVDTPTLPNNLKTSFTKPLSIPPPPPAPTHHQTPATKEGLRLSALLKHPWATSQTDPIQIKKDRDVISDYKFIAETTEMFYAREYVLCNCCQFPLEKDEIRNEFPGNEVCWFCLDHKPEWFLIQRSLGGNDLCTKQMVQARLRAELKGC